MSGTVKRDYYEVLGLERKAGEQEIKSAYRKMAMKFHPDRNPGDSTAEERFKEATEAYSVLADPDKRSRYDRFGHAGVGNGGGGFDPAGFTDLSDIFGDLFSDFFGVNMGTGRRPRGQKGADLRADISIEFEEAAFGVQKQLTIRRHDSCETCNGAGTAPGSSPTTCTTCGGRGQVRFQQGFFSVARTCTTCRGMGSVIKDPCTTCKGTGRVVRDRAMKVDVPAGVEDGTRIRYSGQGEAGAFGGPAGDLYVVVNVKEHSFFEREGSDLLCVVPLSLPQAALGAEVRIPLLDGEYNLRIPAGTQSGTTFKVRGKGVPVLNGSGRGDLYVEVRVQTPTRLSKRQRELLEELGGTLGQNNLPERRSLLDRVKEIFG